MHPVCPPDPVKVHIIGKLIELEHRLICWDLEPDELRLELGVSIELWRGWVKTCAGFLGFYEMPADGPVGSPKAHPRGCERKPDRSSQAPH